MAPSHSQDLLGLFPPAPPLPTSLPPDSEDPAPGQNDTALSNISSVPGAESTRLDSSNVETSEGQINQSQISNNSREVSALLNDIQDLQNDIKEAQSPPEEQPNGDGGEKGDGDDGWGALGGAQEFGGGVESATAWPDSPAFSDAPQPALPAKQRPRPASVARERVANSLISVARPRPGSSLAARASPSSSLFSSALSLPPRDPPPPRERIDSTSSNQSVASLASRTLTSVQRTDSTGSASSLTKGPVGHSGVNHPTRMGPLLPRPHSGSSSPSGRPDSPGGPPSGPPPVLHPHRAPSRGPSPLAVGGADSVPLAVAFQEVVHAAFRGSDESKCMVRLLGDMMLSFPAGIVSVLAANPYPAPLQFRILNAGRLESVLPNKQLIHKVKNLCTSDLLVFEFNMQSLQVLVQMQMLENYLNLQFRSFWSNKVR